MAIKPMGQATRTDCGLIVTFLLSLLPVGRTHPRATFAFSGLDHSFFQYEFDTSRRAVCYGDLLSPSPGSAFAFTVIWSGRFGWIPTTQ